MNSTRQRRLWLGGVALAAALGGSWLLFRPEPPVNLLLITLDTTRADRLGCYGASDVETPALDALAAQGCLFERAFAPVPITLPSHASLMTGLYPPEHGLRVNSGRHRLPSELPVLSERLRKLGYRTGAFIGGFVLDHKYGLDRGFDVYDDTMDQSRHAPTADGHEHSARIGQHVVDAALRWLNLSERRPFFCWVHLFDPHTPYSAREELYGARYRDRPYDAGIAYVDGQVGRLMESLRKKGLDRRTIVVVAGDHGESLGEHEERTHGYTLYGATIQVPLIVRWAGDAPPVRKVSAPVSLVDVFPTLHAILNPGEPLACSGRNLWPACLGDHVAAAHSYAESDYGLDEGVAAPVRSLTTDRWKYIRSPRRELYDLRDDPREERNVAERNPEKVEEFERLLERQEAAFDRRDATPIASSTSEQRKLASLGYTGGSGTASTDRPALPDIKDVLPAINLFIDAQLLMGERDFPQARTKLERVVREVPHYFQAWFNLGVCRQQSGDVAGAVAAFQEVVKLHDGAAVQIALAKVCLSQKQPDQAIPHLELAIQLDPASPEGPFLLGMAYRRQGKLAEARRCLEQALQIDGYFFPARHELQQLP